MSCPLIGFLNGAMLHISGAYVESIHIYSSGPKIFSWFLKVRVLRKAHMSCTLPVWHIMSQTFVVVVGRTHVQFDR